MLEMDRHEVAIARLKRKLAQRDNRITGLENKIKQQNELLFLLEQSVKRTPIEVTRAVQEALCNVRMIPVLGIRSNDRIIEVREADKVTKIEEPE